MENQPSTGAEVVQSQFWLGSSPPENALPSTLRAGRSKCNSSSSTYFIPSPPRVESGTPVGGPVPSEAELLAVPGGSVGGPVTSGTQTSSPGATVVPVPILPFGAALQVRAENVSTVLRYVGDFHSGVQQALVPILAGQSRIHADSSRARAVWQVTGKETGRLQSPANLCGAYGCRDSGCKLKGRKHCHGLPIQRQAI